jgi:DNA-binding sugar fermentation-stimulating protein
MKLFRNILHGTFLARPNRFVINCLVHGRKKVLCILCGKSFGLYHTWTMNSDSTMKTIFSQRRKGAKKGRTDTGTREDIWNVERSCDA